MSSVVIKLGSLVIKTLSKPIANKIKGQAREHERFRRVCVNTAQWIHQWDMRFRLGLLQDTAAYEKQVAREAAAEAQAKRHKHEVTTVKTEAQTKAEEAAAAKSKEKGTETKPEKTEKIEKKKPKIRPLNEAKAIDLGANFVSETFLLLVGVALILGESYRQNRKASSRREDVRDRIAELEEYEKFARKGMVELEREVLRLRAKNGILPTKQGHILPKEVYKLEEQEGGQVVETKTGWSDWMKGLFGQNASGVDSKAEPAAEVPEVKAPEPESQTSTSILSRVWPSNHTLATDNHRPISTSRADKSQEIETETRA